MTAPAPGLQMALGPAAPEKTSDPAGLRPAIIAGAVIVGVFFFGFGNRLSSNVAVRSRPAFGPKSFFREVMASRHSGQFCTVEDTHSARLQNWCAPRKSAPSHPAAKDPHDPHDQFPPLSFSSPV